MAVRDAPPLVSAQWLADHAGDPGVHVAEVRTEPGLPEPGANRIPGALSWFWKDFLWDSLSREFVTPEQAARRLAAQGISDRDTLVLYGRRPQFAIYGYWVLTALCGHSGIRILDGGLASWEAAGYPVSGQDAPAGERDAPASGRHEPAEVAAARDDSTRIRRDEVLAVIGHPDTVIIDARSREEFQGLRVKPAPGADHGAERAGHIPGAVHLPASELLCPDGSLRPAGEIERLFRSAGAAPDQARRVVVYCRLGHRAAMTWFAASRILGWDHFLVYDGSWTEWGSCVGLPIEGGSRSEPLSVRPALA